MIQTGIVELNACGKTKYQQYQKHNKGTQPLSQFLDSLCHLSSFIL